MFLIVGANSEIGSATVRSIRARGGTVLATTRRRVAAPGELHFDFDAPLANFTIPDGVQCACIFVAIARLAACEADPVGSARINVEQTIALVDLLAARGVYTLFLSSNQVFNGDSPHVAADAPMSPISEYGRQKAETERMLRARMADGAPIGVLRLAKVVSPGMPLLSAWAKELAGGGSIRAFTDMTVAPTPVDIVALSIARILEDREPVIAQLAGPRDVTYAEVGRYLAKRIGAEPRLVKPVSALENGVPAGSTPRNTTLDSSFIARKYGLTVPEPFAVIDQL